MSAAAATARVAADLLAWTLRRPATLGDGRLVCLDGPAGSGKTTLAEALVAAAESGPQALAPGGVHLVHMDDVYPGWSGLSAGMATVAEQVVGPLRSGRAGHYRRWDWVADRPGEEHPVPPVPLLVVEGVGSGGAAYADAVTCLVWVHAPSPERLARGLARDGQAVREQWLAWRRAEQEVFGRERSRERADARVKVSSRPGHDGPCPALTWVAR